VKNVLILLLLLVFVGIGDVFADSDTLTREEYEKRMLAASEMFESSLHKMNGNMEVFYLLYDYMGRGYVKLDFDVLFQIKDFKSIKSDVFTFTFSAKDDANFNVKHNWKASKKDIFINGEGDGIFIKKISLEKGMYSNITISITGNQGESANITIPEYSTLQLSDLKTKVGKAFLINSVDAGDMAGMFTRRGRVFVPNLSGKYDKVKMFGFYVEYYHITHDAMHNEGEYELTYSLYSMAFQESIYEQKISKKEVPKSGFVLVPPIDITTATEGIYRLDIIFNDVMGGTTFNQSLYFSVVKNTTSDK